MKKFYRICVCLLVGSLILVTSFSGARQKFQNPEWYNHNTQTVTDPKLNGETISSIEEGIKYENDKQKGVLQFPQKENYSTTLGYALSLIQISINWLLGILATVALIYMLYSGFLVFSSGADDKNAQKGRKGIKTAAIALAGIGLSWLIVSAMIRFITLMTDK